ncbi:MAG: CRISPR-associated endonuclease Cas2 [Clostridia bacterium]|nr:CRISPR-associated endonuclease Cas2 [Clostridia bacterium]
MRLIVLFDLPTLTTQDRREYSRFHRFLIKNGFIMMQESVYCRLSLNSTVQNSLLDKVRKHKPPKGIVQMLTVTERQFSRIEYLVGQYNGDVLNTDERLVEL